jgi:hypothetical protein
MKFDCGMSDAEHCEWELRLQAYELIMYLHKSAGDINRFLEELTASKTDGSGLGFDMADICDDIDAIFRPILKKLQRANKKIRSQYGLTATVKGKDD